MVSGLFDRLIGRRRLVEELAHDLFYPPERVRQDVFLSLAKAGPCDLSELERRTGIAPEYLLDEVLTLGAEGLIKVERRYARRVFRKNRELLWLSLPQPPQG